MAVFETAFSLDMYVFTVGEGRGVFGNSAKNSGTIPVPIEVSFVLTDG